MQAVYFPEELNARAPHAIGQFAEIPSTKWLTLVDIVEAIRRGEAITIRPASDSELRRAEAYIAMFEIGAALAEKMHSLLDQETPEAAAAKVAEMSRLLGSSKIEFAGILDIAKADNAIDQ